MDDLSSKLTELLNDPDSMNRVRQMAESILGENEPHEAHLPSPVPDFGAIGDMLAGGELQAIISAISHMKNAKDDSRIQLLSALKPHLNEERRKRTDTAIKILKLLDALPYLHDSGLLNF